MTIPLFELLEQNKEFNKKCASFFNQYIKCSKNKNIFYEKCYKIYYEKFIICYNEFIFDK